MTTKAPPDTPSGAFASAQDILSGRDAAIIKRCGRQHSPFPDGQLIRPKRTTIGTESAELVDIASSCNP